MHIIGTSTALASELGAWSHRPHRRDALVIVIEPAAGAETGAWSWFERLRDDIHDALRAHTPRLLIVVLDGRFPDITSTAVADELIDDASVFSTNLLGKQATALAITIDDPAHRAATAARVSDHLLLETNLGNGAVLSSRRLIHDSIRSAVLEEVL